MNDLASLICSSRNEADHLWCSYGVTVRTKHSTCQFIVEECKYAWSPGMVLYILPNVITPSIIMDTAKGLTELAFRLGKARRVSLPEHLVSDRLLLILQNCFHCIEKVDEAGHVAVLTEVLVSPNK